MSLAVLAGGSICLALLIHAIEIATQLAGWNSPLEAVPLGLLWQIGGFAAEPAGYCYFLSLQKKKASTATVRYAFPKPLIARVAYDDRIIGWPEYEYQCSIAIDTKTRHTMEHIDQNVALVRSKLEVALVRVASDPVARYSKQKMEAELLGAVADIVMLGAITAWD